MKRTQPSCRCKFLNRFQHVKFSLKRFGLELGTAANRAQSEQRDRPERTSYTAGFSNDLIGAFRTVQQCRSHATLLRLS